MKKNYKKINPMDLKNCLKLLFLFIKLTLLVYGQNQIGNIRWKEPTDCILKNQIFNPISLNCVSCPNGMIASNNAEDSASCVCSNFTNNTKDVKNFDCPICLSSNLKFLKKTLYFRGNFES